MIEHMNSINTYYAQLAALLDLMMMSEDSVDIQSIKTASEMCTTMLNELKYEIDVLEMELENQQGRAELIKQFDESDYLIIHKNEYEEYMPCCYTLKDVAERIRQGKDINVRSRKEQSND